MSTQIHTETLDTVTHAHALFILDHTGHAPTLVWDAIDEATEIVRDAERKFNDHMARGGTAYETDKSGGSATATKKFNPLAERTVLTPTMVGG